MDLEELKESLNAEIENLKKSWEGYNPDTAAFPLPGYEYDQGMLTAYKQILAEIERRELGITEKDLVDEIKRRLSKK